MIWAALLALAAASLALKALGPVVIGDRQPPATVATVLDLLPVPMLAAIVVTGTLAVDRELELDARLPGLGVAAVLVWRRAPFLLVIAAAAATTAALRAL